MSELESAWDEIHAATPMSWQIGRPSFHDEARRWEQYASTPPSAPRGKRSREWIAVRPTKVARVREMARCLREGRWPR